MLLTVYIKHNITTCIKLLETTIILTFMLRKNLTNLTVLCDAVYFIISLYRSGPTRLSLTLQYFIVTSVTMICLQEWQCNEHHLF